jgi:hypothetical protein
LRVHWGVYWIVTFLPFTALCFLSSLIMFIIRARQRR